ncbi:MAG: hypothetical protein N2422_12945, partial [Rhodobacteraceae bacterium]|nr:hypothetical protein [Paracoccaceae bacterium]
MTARAGLRALLLLPGLALAAAETAVAEGHSMGTCAAIFDRLQQLAAPAGSLAPPARTALTPEGCAFTGLHLAPDGPFGTEVRVARLTIGGTGLAAYLAAGTPPVALHLRAEGLRVTAGAGDPVMTYLLAAQSARRGIDAEAKLRRDAADRALALERLTIDLPGDNRVDATARIERVDLSSPAAAQASLGSAVLTRLEATIVSHGLFEDFLLVPLGAALLGATDDPEGEAARLIAGARAALAALPPDSFPDPTRAALDALLA